MTPDLVKKPYLNVLSLGAWVQSTTMALMAAHGEITPMPDCAVFADTGAEPRAVYDHLAWLRSGNVLPFPVDVVRKGNILDDTYGALDGHRHGKGRCATAPFFARGRDGRAAPLRRQCTAEYKIEPITKWLRERLGVEKGKRVPAGVTVTIWIGISTDEIYRVKPAQERWIKRRWPLIDKRMSRWDCLRWIERNGYPPPPRSACFFCPYRSDAELRKIRDNSPDEWAQSVELDRAVRAGFKRVTGERTTGALWLHRSLVPLDQVNLSTAEDHGQLNMFNNECEGMCGV